MSCSIEQPFSAPHCHCALPPSSWITQGRQCVGSALFPSPRWALNENSWIPWVACDGFGSWAGDLPSSIAAPSPCLCGDRVMQGGHIKCTSNTGPQPRHLQRNKCITAGSVLICCCGLPSTKISWRGQLKYNLQYQLHLGIACLWSTLKGPPGIFPSWQEARAGVLFQPLSSHKPGEQQAGDASWMTIGRAGPSTPESWRWKIQLFSLMVVLIRLSTSRPRLAAFASWTLLLLVCLSHSFYLWSSQGEKGSRRICGKLYTQQYSKKEIRRRCWWIL